jgi:NADPH:quinone reductase-like Zn-dependent oxidoreductase
VRAVVIREHGGPEVLRYEQWPDPEPGPGEVVVRLVAASVNHHDVLVRRDGLGTSLPRIAGIDGAGVRTDTGEEVLIQPSLGWGPDPTAPGPDWTILGDVRDGTYAEYVAVPAENLYPKPEKLTWAEAAALPTAGLTAYRALFTRGGLRAGETVVVLGAGSGISTFVVALATGTGAQVFVTSSTSDKIDAAVAAGASGGVRYTDPDWVEQLGRLTGGADVVIDSVGRDTAASLRCLRPGGRLVVFGAPVGSRMDVDVRAFYFSQCSVLGTTLGNGPEFARLLAEVDRTGWHPPVDSEFALAEVAEAHRRMEARLHVGKIVLRCG